MGEATFGVEVRDGKIAGAKLVPTNRYMNLGAFGMTVENGPHVLFNGAYGIKHRIGPDGRLLAAVTLLDVRQAAELKTGTIGELTACVRDAYHGRGSGFSHSFGRYEVVGPAIIDSQHREFCTAAVQLAALDRDPKDIAGLPISVADIRRCRPQLPPVLIGKRHGPTWFWWAFHNLIAHPASEILWWFGLKDLSGRVHDETIPVHEHTDGRG